MERAKGGLGRAVQGVGKFARATSAQIAGQVSDLKETAAEGIEKLTAKEADPYEEAIAEYNAVFTSMSDKGLSLLRQRERSTDVIALVETVVNSIANTPKSFSTDFDEIHVNREQFLAAEEFAQMDLAAARTSAASAGAGFTAGAAVASLAPSAAMWVATTFGTASTGTAISALSGAAASNAALAWLGGGAIAAGGGGASAGGALLALAGPIGWTVAGATLLTSIALFAKAKFENREAKQEALIAVKKNTARLKATDAQVDDILQRTTVLREHLMDSTGAALCFHRADFLALSPAGRTQLATLVNNTKACAALLGERIVPEIDDESADDE